MTADFVSASHAENPSGVTPEMLTKVWRIDNATAKRTVKVNTQLSRQDDNTSLSQNFGINDRILRYRRISSFFYTYCLFLTNKACCCKASSSQGFTCIYFLYQIKNMFLLCQLRAPENSQRHCRCLQKE